jgi:hypothetical protein
MRQSIPAHFSTVLISPDLGEPRMYQARRADEAFARGVGAHHDPGEREPDRHRERSAAATGDQRVGEREVDVGIAEHGNEIAERQVEHAEPVDHRIGIGERAQKQHRDRVEHEERKHDHERDRPQPAGDHSQLCGPFDIRCRRRQRGALYGHAFPSGSCPLAWRMFLSANRYPLRRNMRSPSLHWGAAIVVGHSG